MPKSLPIELTVYLMLLALLSSSWHRAQSGCDVASAETTNDGIKGLSAKAS